MSLSGIYKIQSLIKPDRIYIGSAINIHERWRLHLLSLNKNKHHSKKLQNHFNKYGKNDLQFSILIGCKKEDLLSTEQFFIDSYSPYFNTCKIAGSCLGVKMSEQAKRKISESHLGKKNPHPGYPISQETRDKISKANKGKIPWNKGKPNPHNGYIHTDEQKKRLSEIGKGKKHSEETKKKMSEWRTNYYKNKKELLLINQN